MTYLKRLTSVVRVLGGEWGRCRTTLSTDHPSLLPRQILPQVNTQGRKTVDRLAFFVREVVYMMRPTLFIVEASSRSIDAI